MDTSAQVKVFLAQAAAERSAKQSVYNKYDFWMGDSSSGRSSGSGSSESSVSLEANVVPPQSCIACGDPLFPPAIIYYQCLTCTERNVLLCQSCEMCQVGTLARAPEHSNLHVLVKYMPAMTDVGKKDV